MCFQLKRRFSRASGMCVMSVFTTADTSTEVLREVADGVHRTPALESVLGKKTHCCETGQTLTRPLLHAAFACAFSCCDRVRSNMMYRGMREDTEVQAEVHAPPLHRRKTPKSLTHLRLCKRFSSCMRHLSPHTHTQNGIELNELIGSSGDEAATQRRTHEKRDCGHASLKAGVYIDVRVCFVVLPHRCLSSPLPLRLPSAMTSSQSVPT